ncbi:hypothetical protein EJ04DRAFT_573715 [Polyplosphaeria fusca]|uniref:Uncharacterized protein n=1 Tax=Polyplosphaeria fusca TaxID=682080 RepID=A0A9P4V6P9_9PLEO|nr:hypothetical protein EJ04DRAFT_573715 [Polyplosphaeria fusca]
MPRPPPSPPPPAAAFPFVSGTFDYPRATDSPPATFRGPSLLGGTERDSSAAVPRVDLRRRQLRRALPSEGASEHEFGALSRRLPSPATANRPRATPGERHARVYHRNHDMDAPRLPDVLDSLSDLPVTNPFSLATNRPRSPAGERGTSTRRAKRRKIDHNGNATPTYHSVKYGYKGQVIAGRLKMDIVSCDGGEHEKYSGQGHYKIQNVLRTDKSVYCSESSRCNLLLKHAGEASFCLEKIIIKAPDRGFDAPIQEGLIFVAMSQDDLLSGTAGYNIVYDNMPSPRLSPTPTSRSYSLADQSLSLQDALEDPYIWEHSQHGMDEAMEEQLERLRLRSRRLHVGSTPQANRERRRAERRRDTRPSESSPDDVYGGDNCDDPADSYSPGIAAPTPPPFTVTTETDDESEDSEEQTTPAILADRLMRESRWRASSDEDDFPPPRRAQPLESFEGYRGRWRTERFLDPIRASRLQNPSRLDSKAEDGLIAPHARFFIAKHKNKITIRFSPTISGKYVLLKLWSPTHGGNIDIESVQIYGYSGPRFFPAVLPK